MSVDPLKTLLITNLTVTLMILSLLAVFSIIWVWRKIQQTRLSLHTQNTHNNNKVFPQELQKLAQSPTAGSVPHSNHFHFTKSSFSHSKSKDFTALSALDKKVFSYGGLKDLI
jgi:hypothetical protein